MSSVMPEQVTWLKTAVATFAPDRNEITLEDGSRVTYRVLVVAPGLKLDWAAIPGLPDRPDRGHRRTGSGIPAAIC